MVTYAADTICLTCNDKEKEEKYERVGRIAGPRRTPEEEYRRLKKHEIMSGRDIIRHVKEERIGGLSM